jgi:hypothetical protein
VSLLGVDLRQNSTYVGIYKWEETICQIQHNALRFGFKKKLLLSRLHHNGMYLQYTFMRIQF